MQVVFQDPNSSLNPRLTAQQIIEEGLRVHQPTLTAAEREQAVILAMQEVGLDPASRQRYPRRSPVASDSVSPSPER